jgi:transposase-like protein
MNCPKCESTERVKNGIVRDLQRYKCKKCGFNFTVDKRSTEYPKSMRKKALQLYLEGLGFRSIGRILEVSNVTVLNWIRNFGKEVQALSPDSQEIEMVELDEMHSYVGSKRTIAGSGLLLIDMGKDSSISLLATGAMKRRKSSGKQ